MRHLSMLTAAALVLAVVPLSSAGHAGPVLSEVLADPDTGREFVEIHNPGTQTVDLAGWNLTDAAGNTFTFGSWSLAAGGRVVVWTGGSSDATGPAWSKSAVWNNGGDTVALVTPDGDLADRLAYGAGATGVPGHDATADAAAKGRSLQWDGAAWVEGDPTPGATFGASEGSLSAEVANVAPVPSLAGTSAWARPGKTLEVRGNGTDGNGWSDIAAWRVWVGGSLAASGAALPLDTSVAVPQVGPVTVQLELEDAAGATGNATLIVDLRDSPLLLTAPPGGSAAFPALAPGGQGATSTEAFRLRNDDAAGVVPWFDASPLRGPVDVPMEGRLKVGWGPEGQQQWISYEAPMLALPELAAGAEIELWLRIEGLPEPVPAGSYGLTFTVVA